MRVCGRTGICRLPRPRRLQCDSPYAVYQFVHLRSDCGRLHEVFRASGISRSARLDCVLGCSLYAPKSAKSVASSLQVPYVSFSATLEKFNFLSCFWNSAGKLKICSVLFCYWKISRSRYLNNLGQTNYLSILLTL